MSLSGPQLTLLRSLNQWSKLYLIIRQPNTILTATLTSVPGSTDSVVDITYTLVAGTYTDIKPGMTLLVGTASGGRDLGIARIRKAATSSHIYIGEQSEIHWTAGCYLTVTDNFLPWSKPPRIVDVDNAIWDMDYEITYSDQHTNFSPVPVLGPARVGELLAGTVSFSFDASGSWVTGSTISGHVWSAPGSYSISGGATATPTITYHAVGHYVVYDTVTATNGKVTVGVRYVFVWSQASLPITTFKLTRYHGSYDQGGWEAGITAQGEVAAAAVEPNAYSILFAKDYFANVQDTCPGEVVGCENVLMCGWIDDESITYDSNISSVDFSLKGLTYWLKRMPNFPLYLENKIGTPDQWTNINNLTVDKMLFDCLYWRSTILEITDCFFTGDTKLATYFLEHVGTFYSQLQDVAYATIYATPGVDKYGRLHFDVDPQLVPIASRSGISLLQTLADQDWHDEVAFKRVTSGQISMVAAGGVQTHSDNTATPYLSNAPGTVMAHFGDMDTADNLLLGSQAQLNELAGLLYAWKNNPFPQMVLRMTGNYRVLDLWPLRRLQLVVDKTDTIRDIDFSGYLFVRDINGAIDENSSFIEYEVTFETFTSVANDGITFPVPEVPEPETPPGPEFPPWPGWPSIPGAKTYTWVITTPAVGGIPGPRLWNSLTALRIDAYVVGGTSITFNIEKRSVIGTAGTDLLASDAVAPVAGVSTMTFADASLPQDNWLWLDISALSGVPTKFVVTLTTTV